MKFRNKNGRIRQAYWDAQLFPLTTFFLFFIDLGCVWKNKPKIVVSQFDEFPAICPKLYLRFDCSNSWKLCYFQHYLSNFELSLIIINNLATMPPFNLRRFFALVVYWNATLFTNMPTLLLATYHELDAWTNSWPHNLWFTSIIL